MHWNMAFTANDDCLTLLGTYVAQHLNPGLKFRLACSNEVWNFNNKPYAVAATGSFAFYNGASDDPVPFTCEMSQHQFQVVGAAWAAAGRDPADFIRVMEGLYFDSSFTTRVAQYCHAHGYTFDEFAVAPYLGNRPSFASGYQIPTQFGPMISRLTAEQTLDFMEYHYTYGSYEHEMPGHHNALSGAVNTNGTVAYSRPEFLGVKLITYEGGPETMTVGGGSNWNTPSMGHQVVRHPRWFGAFQQVLLMLQDSTGPGTGCTLFQDYLMSAGDQGPSQSYAQWSAYAHTTQLPYAPGDPTQDAIQVNQFDRVDLVHSVTGGALKHWGSMYLADPFNDPAAAAPAAAPAPAPAR